MDLKKKLPALVLSSNQAAFQPEKDEKKRKKKLQLDNDDTS